MDQSEDFLLHWKRILHHRNVSRRGQFSSNEREALGIHQPNSQVHTSAYPHVPDTKFLGYKYWGWDVAGNTTNSSRDREAASSSHPIHRSKQRLCQQSPDSNFYILQATTAANESVPPQVAKTSLLGGLVHCISPLRKPLHHHHYTINPRQHGLLQAPRLYQTKLSAIYAEEMPFMTEETFENLLTALHARFPQRDHKAEFAKLQTQLTRVHHQVDSENLRVYMTKVSGNKRFKAMDKEMPRSGQEELEKVRYQYALQQFIASLQPPDNIDFDKLRTQYGFTEDFKLYLSDRVQTLRLYQVAGKSPFKPACPNCPPTGLFEPRTGRSSAQPLAPSLIYRRLKARLGDAPCQMPLELMPIDTSIQHLYTTWAWAEATES